MKNALFLLILQVILSLSCLAQNPQNHFNIVFYNVENLFDTIDNTLFNDAEFTPESEKNWNTKKYNKKINDIARVLSSIIEDELPEIIGLAEVENRKVLEDLIRDPELKHGNYAIVHGQSPDHRGIDVALLYRQDEFDYTEHELINVVFPFDTSFTTRDILYVSGMASDGRNLHLFVNHWSSRYGGQKESESKRLYCATTLRRRIDLLLARTSDPRIIIMGDFNDEPTNRSMLEVLKSANKRKNIYPFDLYNLFYDRHNLHEIGTYNYRGNWNMLDHITVSYNLIDSNNGYACSYESGGIYRSDWMLYENEEGIKVPNRTFGGPNYYGGISDHLPVYLRLRK